MSTKRFLRKTRVAKRYDVTTRTIDRWVDNPPTGFPAPIMLNGHKQWDEDLLVAYERHCAAVNTPSRTEEVGADA